MTQAEDMRELMDVWNKIGEAAKEWFPQATPEEQYEIIKAAMTHALEGALC